MSNFTSAAVQSTIQGVIAVACIIGTFLLVLSHQEVPTVVSALDGAVIAFYFTNAQTATVARAVVTAVNGAGVSQ